MGRTVEIRGAAFASPPGKRSSRRLADWLFLEQYMRAAPAAAAPCSVVQLGFPIMLVLVMMMPAPLPTPATL